LNKLLLTVLFFSITSLLIPLPMANASQSFGNVGSFQKISETRGNFLHLLDNGDVFGHTIENLGDLDGDGIIDIAIGADNDDDGGDDKGAVYILFLNSDGTVKSHQKISDIDGGFSGILDEMDFFGHAVINLGDLDSDGTIDIAVSAYGDDDGGLDRGAIYILFLNSDGTVKSHQKISDTLGGFLGDLDDKDLFAIGIVNLGDIDGDGVVDLASGALKDDDGGTDRGAAWILFMNSDGTVKSHQKISDTEGGFLGDLDDGDLFGHEFANMGDLDGDFVNDIAVSTIGDDDGGTDRGAVWILFLNSDGTVKSHQKISDTEGGFLGDLDDFDSFAHSVDNVGDLDNDGTADLVTGSVYDDDGGTDRGAVWILFLNSDGTVKSHQKISDTQGGFLGDLDDDDEFGHYVDNIGDFDGDGNIDLTVGSLRDDDGGKDRGAVYLLFMNDDGTVKSHQKISDTQGGLSQLDNDDSFGKSVDEIGDLDGNGVIDLISGAFRDDDGGFDHGAVYVLFMKNDGTVKSEQKISSSHGMFTEELGYEDWFGYSVGGIGDLDLDNVPDIIVGAFRDDDGGNDRGAFYILFLNSDGTVKSSQKVSDIEGNFGGVLHDDDEFAHSLNSIGDLDGDGIVDIAVGANNYLEGAIRPGAVFILFMNSDGTVKSHQKISSTTPGLRGELDNLDHFGHSVNPIGDFDGDGIIDLIVGSEFDDDGGTDRGAVYLLFMNDDGTIKSHQKISDTQGGFNGILDNLDRFGVAVDNLGDLDEDGVTDLIVGSELDDDGGTDIGAAWILFLNSDGTVKSHQKISDTQGGFLGDLDDGDLFGHQFTRLNDFDGNGIIDVVIGAHHDDDGGSNRGAVWILFLGSPYTTNLITVYNSRPDLQAVFPEVLDGDLARLFNWAGNNGVNAHPNLLLKFDHIYDLMRVYNIRPDVQSVFPEAANGVDLARLFNWAGSNGVNAHPNLLLKFDHILMRVYNIRPDVQSVFPEAANGVDLARLFNWAGKNGVNVHSDPLAPHDPIYDLMRVYNKVCFQKLLMV